MLEITNLFSACSGFTLAANPWEESNLASNLINCDEHIFVVGHYGGIQSYIKPYELGWTHDCCWALGRNLVLHQTL